MTDMTLWIILGAIFFGVTTLVVALGITLRDKQEKQGVSDRLDAFTFMKPAESEVATLLREPIESEADPGPGLVAQFGSPTGKIQKLIVQADLNIGVSTFLLICAGLSVLGACAAIVLHFPAPLIPVGAIAGLLPSFWLTMRRRSRLKKFGAQLPDALELIARALRAGHSLASGFQLVSQEMPPPIATEFQRTYDEQNFGIPLEEALKNLGDRVPNVDLGFFITAVAIQRQTGGDLAEILDKLGYVIRERFKLYGQVQALTAEGRLSGYILNGLPIIILLALLKLNPNYVMLLFQDPLGIKMLAVAGFMQVLGAIAIHKIVNIRV
jgi:tight adherence protein B